MFLHPFPSLKVSFNVFFLPLSKAYTLKQLVDAPHYVYLINARTYVGKWAYEFLVLGEPISNDLATKVLLEYLKSLTNASGLGSGGIPKHVRAAVSAGGSSDGFQTYHPIPIQSEFEDIPIEDVVSVTPRIVLRRGGGSVHLVQAIRK